MLKKMTDSGQVLIPKRMLDKLGIDIGEEVILYAEDDRLVIEKKNKVRHCKICGDIIYGNGESDLNGNWYHLECYKEKLLKG